MDFKQLEATLMSVFKSEGPEFPALHEHTQLSSELVLAADTLSGRVRLDPPGPAEDPFSRPWL